jgi:hypothetical protein
MSGSRSLGDCRAAQEERSSGARRAARELVEVLIPSRPVEPLEPDWRPQIGGGSRPDSQFGALPAIGRGSDLRSCWAGDRRPGEIEGGGLVGVGVREITSDLGGEIARGRRNERQPTN